MSRGEGEKFAKENEMAYFETSAVDSDGAEAPFIYLAHSFLVQSEPEYV